MDNKQTINNYEKKEILGQGSYGLVYKVLNLKDKKYYVLKQIFIGKLKDEEINNIENEKNILESINHENIVKYIDSFKDNNYFSLIMEYCDNSDLLNYIENIKREKKLIN